MEHFKYDMDEPMIEGDIQDYNVLPRPPELIYSQLQSSSSEVSGAKAKEKALKERLEKRYNKEKRMKKKEESAKPGPPAEDDGAATFLKNIAVSSTSDENLSKDQKRKKMKEKAFAAQERYDILNQRDSDLREQETTRLDSKRKVIKGTCPDMCPEKERYSRVAKNCLSVYEMKRGTDPASNSKDVDHRLMIKEYSRSSADQQEPLPNELRPVSVLKFTMDYLICNIIDKRDTSIPISEWYDFIWNRTRSIRKDITQQQLGDVDSVDILEKCARFHILCAEFLSEQDTATFDPKINNENLNKCLQTLKHMYYDLQTKGVQCPNEDEFRAYDILLSLSEGETLRLVKDFRKEIFKTSHVKLAFDAALAFQSNNFVKFFHLMEKASYLSSCIMHRYMHEGRIRAMNVIVRSYTVKNKPTSYPLSSLVRDLKFRDTAEAAQFCRWHGLEADETEITLWKKVFRRPSSSYPVERSSYLVGKKLVSGFGVIVNNGPLPENPLIWYQPRSSFDEYGSFVEETNDFDDEEEEDEESVTQEMPSSPEGSVVEDSPFFSEVQQEKEQTDAFESLSSRGSTKDNEEEIPLPQSEIKIQQSSFLSPVSVEENSAVKPPSVPFSFKSTQAFSTSPATFIAPLMSTFFSKEPHTSFEAAKQTAQFEKSFDKGFIFQSSEARSSAAKAPFKWPVFERIEEEEDRLIGDVPAPEEEEDVSIQSMTNEEEEKSLAESEGKESDFENETIENLFPNTEPVSFGNSPEIYISGNEDISIPEQEEKTSDLYDKIDEETLEKIREEKILELITTIAEEVNLECIKELSFDICSETLSEEWDTKHKHDDLMAAMENDLCRKVIYKWKLFCERKKQKRSTVEPLSPWTPMLMNSAYITSGATTPYFAYKNHCSLSRLADKKRKERVLKRGWEPLSIRDFPPHWKSLNLSPVYLRQTQLDCFIKVGIILLKFEDENIDTFEDWIHSKFEFSTDAKRTKGSRLFHLRGEKSVICFSIITLSPDTSDSLDDFIRGTSAVMICCPESFPDFKVFQSSIEKITEVLEPASLLFPFPVYCCVLPTKQKTNVLEQLTAFMNEKLYTSCVFSSVKRNRLFEPSRGKRNSYEIMSGIMWLCENQRPLPVLRKSTVIDYMKDSYISAFNWVFWKLSLPEFEFLYQTPENTINFYNKVLEFRAEILCSPYLMQLSKFWPPKELLVQEPEHEFIKIHFQNALAAFFQRLRLPDFGCDPLNLLDLWNYVRGITVTANADSEMLLISVKDILKKSGRIDWPKILGKCANYILCYQSSKIEKYLEEPIYYLKEELKNDFNVYFKTVISTMCKPYSVGKKRKFSESCDPEHDHHQKRPSDIILDETNESKKSNVEDLSSIPDVKDVTTNRVGSMLDSLKDALKKQIEEEDELIDKLNQSINDEKLLIKTEPLEDPFLWDTPQIINSSTPLREIMLNASNTPPKDMSKPVVQKEKNSLDSASGDILWKSLIGKDYLPEVCTTSSLSEKLDELRYNIKRNNILEDNYSVLLDDNYELN